MELITPAQLEALTGHTVENQRAWERAGVWRGHFELTKGGQRRFKPMDVAYVASMQALSKSGLKLAVCSELLQFAEPFFVAKLQGLSLKQMNLQGFTADMAKFAVFAFHQDHETEDAWKHVHRLGDTEYKAILLKDLNRSMIYSKGGGHHFFVDDLVANLPRAVLDLLPAWREMP